MTYDDDYDDDGYDEYAETDDEYPEPGQGYVGDSETLLRRSIDIIATAPDHAAVVVADDQPRGDHRAAGGGAPRMPDELRQARWMLKERQDFIDKTKREAEDILDGRPRAGRAHGPAHRGRAGRASMRARQIVEAAENEARRMKLRDRGLPATSAWPASRSSSSDLLKTVGVGRERLSIGAQRPAVGCTSTRTTRRSFFDQDQ